MRTVGRKCLEIVEQTRSLSVFKFVLPSGKYAFIEGEAEDWKRWESSGIWSAVCNMGPEDAR